MSNFNCTICERHCETSKHGVHVHDGKLACSDCHYGEIDETIAEANRVMQHNERVGTELANQPR